MVNNEGFTVTDNESDKDDDDDETLAKRSLRRSLFSVEAAKEEEKKTESKRKLTLPGNLWESLNPKKDTLKKEVTEQPKSEPEKAEAKEPEVVEPEAVTVETASTDEDVESTDLVMPVEAVTSETQEELAEIPSLVTAEADPADTSKTGMEAATWEAEGELENEGEIDLTAPKPAAAEADPDPNFAELPPAPVESGVEPTTETGPVEPELLDTGIGNEGPPEPPETAPPDYNEGEPEEPNRGGNNGYAGGVGTENRPGPWRDVVAEEKAHQQELADAEYYGRRKGVGHGLLVGGVVGWLFGRRGKKKAALEHEKAMKLKDKEIKVLKGDQLTAEERFKTVRATQEHITSNLAEQQAKIAEATHAALKTTTELKKTNEVLAAAMVETGAEKPNQREAEKIAETAAKLVELMPAVAKISKENISNRSQENFTVPKSEKEVFAQQTEQIRQPDVERQVEDTPIAEEIYTTPDGRRVETSAWHRIEIDEKTGKVAENPSLAYGEEFKRERHQEVKKDDSFGMAGSAKATSSLGGLAASSAAAGTPSAGSSSLSVPSQSQYPSATSPQKAPKDPHHAQLTAGAELLRFASMPVIWIVAVLIVVVLFVFGFLH